MKRRSGVAIAAQHRNAGPMKDRRAPRGGQRNEQAELHQEFDWRWCDICGSYLGASGMIDCLCDGYDD